MNRLELKIPPPVIAVLCALSMSACERLLPPCALVAPWNEGLITLLILGGLGLDLMAFRAFRQGRTTINPLRPDRSSKLVSHGIYRLTRNPMYLGQGLLLAAWALWLNQALALLVLPVYVAWLTRFQILPEERILGEKFGLAYAEYQRHVRRWI